MKYRLLLFVILFLCVTLNGCTLGTTVRDDGSIIHHYFGYVRVINQPATNENQEFRLTETETYGLRIQRGIGLGYFYDRNEFIPLDCRVVVRVRNDRQLERTLEVLSPIIEEGLCVKKEGR